MLLFYIDDNYDESAIAFYRKNKVALPTKGMTYTIRKVLSVKGQYILLLNEINNKKMGANLMEPGFHYARFTDVPGNVLEWEKVDIILSMRTRHNNEKCKIKSDDIVREIRNRGYAMDGGQLREIMGHIRRNDLVSPGFILSDNGGYWYSEDLKEMEKAWESELSRAKSILNNFMPLKKRVRSLNNQKGAML
jgi:hypothetical protein